MKTTLDFADNFATTHPKSVFFRAVLLSLLQENAVEEANTLSFNLCQLNPVLSPNDMNFRARKAALKSCYFPEHLCILKEWNSLLSEIESGVNKMQASAKAFEVRDIPAYMDLKAMRREMKVTKRVWDYINMFESYVTAWKKARWKEIEFSAIDEVRFDELIKTLA
ncbi:unnamed protein product [Protopolystoma xenopodis]|uniref:Dynein heavy chain tail domain-containing protein n=1 Tax=Protopolystoma xenopodis TaxID=117903 RepID=A0A448WWM3_9PLAT|nr:unnamed protein product [Protopolystoma xenopodis]